MILYVHIGIEVMGLPPRWKRNASNLEKCRQNLCVKSTQASWTPRGSPGGAEACGKNIFLVTRQLCARLSCTVRIHENHSPCVE